VGQSVNIEVWFEGVNLVNGQVSHRRRGFCLRRCDVDFGGCVEVSASVVCLAPTSAPSTRAQQSRLMTDGIGAEINLFRHAIKLTGPLGHIRRQSVCVSRFLCH